MYFASLKELNQSKPQSRHVKRSKSWRGEATNNQNSSTPNHSKENKDVDEKTVLFFRRRSFANCAPNYNQSQKMKRVDEIYPTVPINEHERKRQELIRMTKIDFNIPNQVNNPPKAVRFIPNNRRKSNLVIINNRPRLSFLIQENSDKTPLKRKSNLNMHDPFRYPQTMAHSNDESHTQNEHLLNSGRKSNFMLNTNQLITSQNNLKDAQLKSIKEDKNHKNQKFHSKQILDYDTKNDEQQQSNENQTSHQQQLHSVNPKFSIQRQSSSSSSQSSSSNSSNPSRQISPPQSLNQSSSFILNEKNRKQSQINSKLSSSNENSPASGKPSQRFKNHHFTVGASFSTFSDIFKTDDQPLSPVEIKETPTPNKTTRVNLSSSKIRKESQLLKSARTVTVSSFQPRAATFHLQSGVQTQRDFNSVNTPSSSSDTILRKSFRKNLTLNYQQLFEKKQNASDQILNELQNIRRNQSIVQRANQISMTLPAFSKPKIIFTNSIDMKRTTSVIQFAEDVKYKLKTLSLHQKFISSQNSASRFGLYSINSSTSKSTFANSDRNQKNKSPLFSSESSYSISCADEQNQSKHKNINKKYPESAQQNQPQRQHNRSISSILLLSHPPPPSLSTINSQIILDSPGMKTKKSAFSENFNLPLTKEQQKKTSLIIKPGNNNRTSTFSSSLVQKPNSNSNRVLPSINKLLKA